MPTIFIFAGPNGAGKTSLAQDSLPDRVPLISPDDIFHDRDLSAVAAAREAIKIREAQFKLGKSFAIDTTFSGTRPYDVLTAASAHDFSTQIVAVLLNSLDLAKQRVADRVSLGGHAVPSTDIERRFGRCMENLRALPPMFNELSIYDNSGAAPRHILTITPTQVVIHEPPPSHIVEATPNFAREPIEQMLARPLFLRSSIIPLVSKDSPPGPDLLGTLDEILKDKPSVDPGRAGRPMKPKGKGFGD